MASRSVPRSPSGSRVSCMVLAGEGSASSLALWLGGVWAGRGGRSWGCPAGPAALDAHLAVGTAAEVLEGPGPGERCEYVCP